MSSWTENPLATTLLEDREELVSFALVTQSQGSLHLILHSLVGTTLIVNQVQLQRDFPVSPVSLFTSFQKLWMPEAHVFV